jgi:hypothetical protein
VSKSDGSGPDVPIGDVAGRVLEQLAALTGRKPDGVAAIRRTDDGWRLLVDITDVERVPATTNVMATLEVDASTQGDVVSYERVRRFYRNAAEGS